MSLASFNVRLSKLESKLGEAVSVDSGSPGVDNSEELAKLSGKMSELEAAMQSSSLECKELTNLNKSEVEALSQKIGSLEEMVKKLDKKFDALKKLAKESSSNV